MNDFAFHTIDQFNQAYASGNTNPLAVTEWALAETERLEPVLNMFATLDAKGARAQARESTQRWQSDSALGPLDGVPTSIKDLIAMKGLPIQFGSRSAAGRMVDVDAPAVRRLRSAGAIILGKSTTSEFGCKAVGNSPLTGVTRNPWNPDKTPGGSSCGAAAMVAAGIVPFAIGTDGGGSIRIPAALSGLFGIKANFGRVPIAPTSATPTLAHVGPLTRTIADAAAVLEVIAGHDRRDPFAVAGPVPDWRSELGKPIKGMRVLYSPTLGYARPQAHVVKAVETVVETLKRLGVAVETLDAVFETDPVDLWNAEFYAGVGTKLKATLESNRESLDPAVTDVLDEAVAQKMSDYYARVFARYDMREHVRELFERCDLLVTPTIPVSSVPVWLDVPEGYADRNIVSWVYYTYPFNLTGQPAASVPCGHDSDGMPIGAQLVAGINDEAAIFRAAAALETAQPWNTARPDLTDLTRSAKPATG